MSGSDRVLDTQALSTYLSNHIANFTGEVTATKFDAGQSNPTYLLTNADNKYVLRTQPLGKLLKSAHAVDREYRVLSALADTNVPVPATLHFCENTEIIGTMFYIMEFLDGRVMWNPALPDLSKQQRHNIYKEMARVLAELHSVDIDAVGLSDFGKPGNYFERQLGRWTGQYKASETDTIEEMDTLIEWLAANMPPDDNQASLTHGDFRLDNMMFHPSEERVIALLDWELSTLGHPIADLAYQCMQLRMPQDGLMPGLAGTDRAELGIPTEQQYVNWYCEARGIDEIKNWNFYVAFSFFRFAAIIQGVLKRAIDGNASSDKAYQMGKQVQPLAKLAMELI